MHKTLVYTCASLLFFSVFSCKKSDSVPEIPVITDAKQSYLTRLVYKTITLIGPGRLANDTMDYSYDDLGRLKSVSITSNTPNGIIPGYILEYSENNISAMNILDYNGNIYRRYPNVATISRDQQQVTTTFIWPSLLNPGEDTLIAIYDFRKELLVSGTFYQHNVNSQPFSFTHTFNYNADSNITAYIPGNTALWTAVDWDDQKNFFQKMAPAEFLLFHNGREYYSHRGKNNPTKMLDSRGLAFELLYDYNAEGYPIKMTVKHPTYIESETYYFYSDIN